MNTIESKLKGINEKINKVTKLKEARYFSISDSAIVQNLMSKFSFLTLDDFDSHASDLYVKYYPEVDKWFRQNYDYYRNITKFRSNRDNSLWLEVPFVLTEGIIINKSKKLTELQTVEVTYEDGTIMRTSVSDKVNQQDIEDYWLGRRFDLGVYPKERLVKAVKVRFVEGKRVESSFRKLSEESEEEKAKSAIKTLIETDWGKDNDSQGKASETFKALAFNDSKVANDFMDEVNKFTTGLKNKYLVEKLNEIKDKLKEAELWSGGVKTKEHPPEDLFATGSAQSIANWAKSSHGDLQSAMASLNFYINRAGENLSADRKAIINNAKDKLSGMY